MKNDLVIHVNTDNMEMLQLAFEQAANYRRETILRQHKLSAKDIALNAGLNKLMEGTAPFNLVMVANGPVVRMFVKGNAELQAMAEDAVAHGLKIHVGNYAVEKYGISRDDLWPFVEVVPSVTLDIVHMQEEGFSYLKV